MLRLKEYKKDIFYTFFLFVITIFVFWKIIFLKNIFWGSETITYHYPYYFYISKCFKEGIFPLWSPYIFCGHPIFAVSNAGVLYPFNLLFSYFPSLYFYNCLTIFHFFLAGLFMYIFCRIIQLGHFSSFVSSLAFAFSRFFFFYLHAPSYIHSTIWLPLILTFLEIWIKKKRFTSLFFATIFLSIQFFGGDTSLNLICLFFIFFYFLFKIVTINSTQRVKLIYGFLFLILGASGLFAVQLLPSYELAKLSFRAYAELKDLVEGSFNGRTLLAYLFCPNFPVGYTEKYKLNVYIDTNFIFAIIFTMFLAFLSFLKKDNLSKFLIVLMFLSLVLVLGENTFVYRIFYYIPFYKLVRYPPKFLFIYYFSLAILIGISLNYLLNLKADERKKSIILCYGILFFYLFIFVLLGWLSYFESSLYFDNFIHYLIKEGYPILTFIFISFILLILYLKNKIATKVLKSAILFIFVFSLYFNTVNKIPFYEGKYFSPESNVSENLFLAKSDILKNNPGFINFLKNDNELYRIYPYEKYLFLSNIFSFYEIYSIFGYSALELKDYKDFLAILQKKDLLRLLNVKYILFPSYLEFVHPHFKLVYDKEVRIYQSQKFLPRLFFVSKCEVIKEKKQILRRLGENDFNPLEYVILEEQPRLVQSPRPTPSIVCPKVQGPKSLTEIIKYSPLEVIINANLKENGFLVLSDTYYPGWKVYINGIEDKIYRANYLFRAVYLEKGMHKIRFMYEPPSFKIGVGISIFTLFFLIVIVGYAKIRALHRKIR